MEPGIGQAPWGKYQQEAGHRGEITVSAVLSESLRVQVVSWDP